MQTLKGISLNRSIRQATVVFALFVAYAASAAETQQASWSESEKKCA